MKRPASSLRPVYIAGLGMTAFGRHMDRTLASLADEAFESAVRDEGGEDDVDVVVFSNAAQGVLEGQEMIRGQVALKDTRLAGLPLFNTENACASGSAALHLAWLMVASGRADRAVAIGSEKLLLEDKTRSFAAIESGTDLSISYDGPTPEQGSVMMGAYAAEARRYAEEFGSIDGALAAIAVKNREFASHNPRAQYRTPITAQEVMESRVVAPPLRLLTCSPLTDGAAAILLTAEKPRGRMAPPVTILGCESVTAQRGTSVVERAVGEVLRGADAGIEDVNVFQLHDASAFAELLQYEQVGLAQRGGAAELALAGVTALGGAYPVNTDGGLLSRGHALGATGLAQVGELVLQLRGQAQERQTPGARLGLSVNSGGWMGWDYATAFTTLLAST